MTRKMIKKMLALLLVVLMLCSLCACGEKSESKDADNTSTTSDKRENDSETTIEPEVDIVAEAETLIAQGKYEDAYMLLKDQEDVDAVALREKFVFVPSGLNLSDYDYNEEVTLVFTYASDNNVMTARVKEQETLVEQETLIYNDRGHCLSEEEIEEDGSRHISMSTYTYDENGNILTERHNSDFGDELITYTYDTRGNKISKTKTRTEDDGDTITYTYTYTYDENDRLLMWMSTSDSVYTSQNVCTYDKNGNLLSEVYDEHSKYIYTYDENNRVLTEETISDESYAYTYDENGYPIQEVCIHSNGIYDTYTIVCDQKGNPTQAERCFDDSDISILTFDYDSFGNLIKVDAVDEEQGDIWTVSIAWKLCYYPEGVPDVTQLFRQYALRFGTQACPRIVQRILQNYPPSPVNS